MQTDTIYPLKKPNKKPKALSIEPTPVQVTALPKAFPQQIEKAGVFSIVLECISKITAQKITKSLKIPTIGIGSSNFCDGQILVTDDLLGLTDTKIKFVKKYADLKSNVRNAVKKFNLDVKKGSYPSIKYSY